MPLLLAAGAAAAPPRCAPLSELAFRASLLDLRTALELDRPSTHAALVERVVADLPCLDFAVSGRLWAEFLVHVGLREFAAGGDWERPLAAALRLHPSVDRGVGPGHPMAEFAPPEGGPEPTTPASPARLWFVDGDPALTLPETGLHLVQATDGRWWGSRATWGGGLDGAWLRDPIRPPAHLAAWARAGIVGGAAVGRQAAHPRAADWFPSETRPSPAGAVVGWARVAAWSPVGLAVEGRAPFARDAWPEARGTAAVAVGSGAVGLGAGGVLAGVRVAEGPPQRVWLAYPAASVEGTLGGARRALDLRASGGAWASVASGTAEAAWGPAGAGPAWRLLVRADAVAGRLRQRRTAVTVDAAVWTLGAGVAIGGRSDP